MRILLVPLLVLSVGCATTIESAFDILDRTVEALPAVLESVVQVHEVVQDIKAGQDEDEKEETETPDEAPVAEANP